MQTTGYIIDNNGEKILLLVRQSKYYRHLKIRKTGKDGIHLVDEEIYLNRNPQKLKDIKEGLKTIC